MSGISKILEKRQHIGEHWFCKLVNTYLLTKDVERVNKGAFYGSALGNPCDRFLCLHYNGMLPAQKKTILGECRKERGKAVEEKYAKYFRDMKILIAHNSRINLEDPPIHAILDFQLKLNGLDFVVELKSVGERIFNSLQEARQNDIGQLQSYLNMLNIEHGGVFYESDDGTRTKFFEVVKDSFFWQQQIERCHKVMGMVQLPLLKTVENIHDKFCPCLRVKDGIGGRPISLIDERELLWPIN